MDQRKRTQASHRFRRSHFARSPDPWPSRLKLSHRTWSRTKSPASEARKQPMAQGTPPAVREMGKSSSTKSSERRSTWEKKTNHPQPKECDSRLGQTGCLFIEGGKRKVGGRETASWTGHEICEPARTRIEPVQPRKVGRCNKYASLREACPRMMAPTCAPPVTNGPDLPCLRADCQICPKD